MLARAFQNAGAEQHHQHPAHQHRRGAAGVADRFKPGPLAGKGQGRTDPEPRRPGEHGGEEFGDAVDHQPSANLHPKPMLDEHRQEGAKHAAVLHHQKGGRQAEGEAERERQQRHLGIVGEEEGRHHREQLVVA